jgi:hypothetical protein
MAPMLPHASHYLCYFCIKTQVEKIRLPARTGLALAEVATTVLPSEAVQIARNWHPALHLHQDQL